MKTLFLTWLAAKIEATPEAVDTKTPIEEGEQSLGVMSEALKILFTVYDREVEDFFRINEEHKAKHREGVPPLKEECLAVHADLEVRSNRLKTLGSIVWQEVNEEFGNGTELGNVGFRQGFQIVKCPEPSGKVFTSVEISVTSDLPPELRRFLGVENEPSEPKGFFRRLFCRKR
jgi:hypothetical protein